ncbi:hypothetical protein EDD16DRAFT_862185 [Pisolithus croceorrhizus]|nr:hypothetical protein F5141DRAFT_1187001 [Pisolithus sp. B1]KAI6131511.1 hypothetical protein EDD16DRAFT_862185 [Pisolithus croceorrhizus]KAI6134725.1 hypothetical protein EV401DRAFT_2085526 [Pisolithus croceorrhizus]
MNPYVNQMWTPRRWYHPQSDPRVFAPIYYAQPYGWPAPQDRTRPQSKYPNLNSTLAADTTLVRYDVRKAPYDGILFSTAAQLGPTSALSSPSSAIRIISRSFPWTLDIQAPVTCAAVFDGLYKMLQEPLADSEWGIVCTLDKSRRETIEKAAKARMERDKVKKLKRIDWLGDMTAFKGLEKDDEFEKKRLLPEMAPCPETWVAKFGKS